MKAEEVYQIRESVNKQVLKNIADSLAEEMARKMYYKLLMLKHLSEVKAVEKGNLKALRGKEIHKFLNRLIKSK